MCNAYNLLKEDAKVRDWLPLLGDLADQWYIRPKSENRLAYRRREDGELEVFRGRWGLTPRDFPRWNHSYSTWNARGREIASKRMYRKSFRDRRCLVPASGFIENYHHRVEGRKKVDKLPYWVREIKERPLLLAGIWDRWVDKPSGETRDSFAFCTIEPSEDLVELHDRMPLILDDIAAHIWLAGDASEKELMEFIRPAPKGTLKYWQTDPAIRKIKRTTPLEMSSFAPVLSGVGPAPTGAPAIV